MSQRLQIQGHFVAPNVSFQILATHKNAQASVNANLKVNEDVQPNKANGVIFVVKIAQAQATANVRSDVRVIQNQILVGILA